MMVASIDYQASGAGPAFTQSLRETGFAVLRNHPLPAPLILNMYKSWARFFNSNEKWQYQLSLADGSPSREGYIPLDAAETALGSSTRDIKEYYHCAFGGPVPPQLAADVDRYRVLALDLGRLLLTWLRESSPSDSTPHLHEPLEDILAAQTSLLRILHYPPLTGAEPTAALRAAAHEDINLITLLPIADQPGLQVQDKAGDWIDVASHRGDLVINAGDMLQEATVGYFPSTSHRVLNPDDRGANISRLSMPYFMTPRLNVQLSARYSAQSYLEERLTAINR